MLTTLLRFVIEHASSFQDCWFFFLTFVGATITQVFSLYTGTVAATPFLQTWFKEKSDTWYARRNSVLIVFLGTILSYIILEPDTAKTSLFAGLTWCGTLQSLGKKI